MQRTSDLYERIRSALRGSRQPQPAPQDDIYARMARQYHGQVEPKATPSQEMTAIRLDEMVGEFPIVEFD